MDLEIATMFGLALLSVSIWTLRIAITARGLKLASAVMAAVEAVVYVLAFSQLVTDLGSPTRILSYAAGVGVGTAVGLILDDKTARGHTELHLMALGDRTDLVDHFRDRGWPATSSAAVGPEGPVTMVWLTVADSEVRQVSDLTRQWAPEAFWTLRRLREVTASQPDRDQRSCSSPEAPGGHSRRWRPGGARPIWRVAARRLEPRQRPAPAQT